VTDEKQHQALYRRYRPQTPQEVLGQDHVVRALTGAVREGRLHHAFLFCGPRGTGKTSTARILAKMVNCESGPTVEPCGTCRQCVAIRDGSHLDVVEIDAASHGGVEDARELRERAPTAPAMGREKVYIIDEAQRLSAPAFDALLKLFEEPPAGVRFVLATTEPQKMPATIVGRCQRFDFRRIPTETQAELLQRVADAEGVKLLPEAAQAIARQAEGSARDALSMLDQANVLGAGEVDEDVIRSLLGAPRAEVQHELADAVAVGDARAAFEIVDRLVQEGQDLRHVTAETLAHFRNLLLVKSAPGQEDLLDVAADEYEHLRAQAGKFAPAELARVLALLLAAQSDMRWTTSPRLSLELALVRATMPETDPQPAGLLARIERLERLANIDVAQEADVPVDDRVPERAEPAPELPAEEPGPAQPPPAQEPADVGNVDTGMLRRGWSGLLEHLHTTRQPILKALLESATVAAFDGAVLELAFPPDKRFGVRKVEDRADELRAALADRFGIRPEIRCIVRDGPAPVDAVEEDEVPDEAEALRRVQEMLGAQIAPEA
jgi:DNA polymerase-3 subunit gamma/tau